MSRLVLQNWARMDLAQLPSLKFWGLTKDYKIIILFKESSKPIGGGWNEEEDAGYCDDSRSVEHRSRWKLSAL